MKLFVKILIGVFAAAGIALCYLVFSQSVYITDLTRYIQTMPARKARWRKEDPEPDPQPEPIQDDEDKLNRVEVVNLASE